MHMSKKAMPSLARLQDFFQGSSFGQLRTSSPLFLGITSCRVTLKKPAPFRKRRSWIILSSLDLQPRFRTWCWCAQKANLSSGLDVSHVARLPGSAVNRSRYFVCWVISNKTKQTERGTNGSNHIFQTPRTSQTMHGFPHSTRPCW